MGTEIETTRLLIRSPVNEDILLLENLWRNEKVREFLGGIVADELIRQKVAALQNHWILHQFGQGAVVEKNSNEIAGVCGLHHSEDGIEISYMFFPQFWRKGFAHEAVIASINYGFQTIRMESIIAITQAKNTRSWKLLNKIGMHYHSSFERFNALQYLYKLIQEEWLMKNDKIIATV